MTRWTAAQIRDMVAHIEGCPDCSGDDQDIIASTHDESLPPEELAEYIATTHSPEWAAFVAQVRN